MMQCSICNDLLLVDMWMCTSTARRKPSLARNRSKACTGTIQRGVCVFFPPPIPPM